MVSWLQIVGMGAFWVTADLIWPGEANATLRVLTFSLSLLTLCVGNWALDRWFGKE